MQAPRKRRGYVPRFAGEAFGHAGSSDEGPDFRKLVSEVAWKQPPSSKLKSEVAT